MDDATRRPLEDYRAKRDFGATPEPPGGRGGGEGAPVFVVHRHDARRLHFDLRLEMEGVLKSWAVPKGFCYDPAEKRLAVRTEDHPLEYEHFHGIIPEGQYGAGSMTIWDRGYFEVLHAPDGPTAVEAGELKLILHGRRLRGEWHLVRTKQDEGRNWLLFKSRDCYSGPARDSATGVDLALARPAPLPARVRRMQPQRGTQPFSDPEWLFEMRFEGKRVLVSKQGEVVRLRGLRRRLPELEQALLGLHAEGALLDGVLVVLDEQQRPSRKLLQRRLAGQSEAPLYYYAFDLLYYDEFDLRPCSLRDRKTALRAVLPSSTTLLYVDHVAGHGERLARAVGAAGLPGMLAKRMDAGYGAGPSPDWVDIDVERGPAPGEGSVSEALARPGRVSHPRLKLSHLEKVFWPAEGYTKGDLLDWYDQVADVLLPYLADRPVHMNRFPDGIEGKSFYQRHVNETIADWVPRRRIESESKGELQSYVICNDRDTLLYLANLGSIDLHPWMSRWQTPDEPDYAIIDLDPKQAPFEHVVAIARVTGRLLQRIGLRPGLKTSGSTGLHIVIPLQPGYSYEHGRMFCEGVARCVCRELKDIATVERNPGKRGGKVYVDFLQNSKGQTVVPAYVPRPVPGATVSTPLHWHELDGPLHPSMFTIRTVLERLDREGDLLLGTLTDPQDLEPAIEVLSGLLRS